MVHPSDHRDGADDESGADIPARTSHFGNKRVVCFRAKPNVQ